MKPLATMDSNMLLLQKVLDLRSANQNVIAANVANAETPGYARAKFEFEGELKQAITRQSESMVTTHHKHIPIGPGNLDSVNGTVLRVEDQTGIGDENGVSVEQEMLALSENQLLYETAAQLLKKKMTMLNYAVSEGK